MAGKPLPGAGLRASAAKGPARQTRHSGTAYAVRGFCAGAKGYVTKSSPPICIGRGREHKRPSHRYARLHRCHHALPPRGASSLHLALRLPVPKSCHGRIEAVGTAGGYAPDPVSEITGKPPDCRTMTQRRPRIRFASPARARVPRRLPTHQRVSHCHRGTRTTSEQFSAALEQIWNASLCTAVPCEGALPAHRRRQPLKPDLTPNIMWPTNNSGVLKANVEIMPVECDFLMCSGPFLGPSIELIEAKLGRASVDQRRLFTACSA
jgi:hypothetical protein